MLKKLPEFWETCISLKVNHSEIYYCELTISWNNKSIPNISGTSPI